MKRYVGTKTLSARPMTRGEYLAYRGWPLPEGEDPADAGYLVEYEDGGKANDSRHLGYISWSPADVFERTYKPVPTDHRDRVRLERAQLEEKCKALAAFSGTSIFAALPAAEQQRMRDQLDVMREYSRILLERIDAFGG